MMCLIKGLILLSGIIAMICSYDENQNGNPANCSGCFIAGSILIFESQLL